MGGKVRSIRRLCASALGAAVLTACGSTAQPGNSVGGGGDEQLSGSANLDVPGSSNPESPGTVAAGQAGSSQPLNAGAGVAASLPGNGTTSARAAGAPTAASAVGFGPGVTANTIRVGFTIQQ